MDAHDLVAAVKQLALELGRTPNRREFEGSVKGGGYQLAKFGGYVQLLHAAGLEPLSSSNKPKKIDNSIFRVSIEDHLAKHEPPIDKPCGPFPTAAIISDIHWPFSNQRIIDRFYSYVEQHQPEWVIINGDAWDMYSHSKYPRSHNVFTPREEQRLARESNEKFWAEVRRLSPKSRCIQMMGNHDLRPMKRVLESYPEAEDWIEQKLKELFTFPGVDTIFDPRQELFLNDDIIVFHGYRMKLGDHRDYTLYSTFNGHTHSGGCVFRKIRGGNLFECNSGYAGDPTAKGLTYSAQKLIKSTPGFAVMDAWGPRFIPC